MDVNSARVEGHSLERVSLNEVLRHEQQWKDRHIERELAKRLGLHAQHNRVGDMIARTEIERWFAQGQSGSMSKPRVVAFDVDAFYGAVYFITSDHWFFRIKRSHTQSGSADEHVIDDEGFRMSKWEVTHQAALRDVLPL